jgi:hypothetical protein
MRIVAAFLAFGSLALSSGCASPKRGTADTAIQGGSVASAGDDETSGWHTLFDGTSTDQWRGYRADTMPSGWKIVDGTLTRVGPGGDIVTRDQFRNFELTLEWNIAPGGNSGIMYRVREDSQHTYQSGPEMQVLDDARHPDGKSLLTSAGALYGLYPTTRGVVKPPGEWNAVRIVVNGNHVEHWLNGVKVVDAELGSPDWEKRVSEAKFKEWPQFGRAKRGHIALQDHGDWVAYRNIKIKVLP